VEDVPQTSRNGTEMNEKESRRSRITGDGRYFGVFSWCPATRSEATRPGCGASAPNHCLSRPHVFALPQPAEMGCLTCHVGELKILEMPIGNAPRWLAITTIGGVNMLVLNKKQARNEFRDNQSSCPGNCDIHLRQPEAGMVPDIWAPGRCCRYACRGAPGE